MVQVTEEINFASFCSYVVTTFATMDF